MLDKTRAHYEAMNESFKRAIVKKGLSDLSLQIQLIEKVESDIYNVQLLQDQSDTSNKSRIDLAKLCQQIVQGQKDFAGRFHVDLQFMLRNFGSKDIAPLTVANFPVKPEELTGPFFTISCDVKKLEILIKKLIDISTLLASTQPDAKIVIALEQTPENSITLTVTSSCQELTKEERSDIFIPYYGKLYSKTYLNIGSGFEGYLAKKLGDILQISLTVEQKETSLAFTAVIKKS
jgi:hypothetical protein